MQRSALDIWGAFVFEQVIVCRNYGAFFKNMLPVY